MANRVVLKLSGEAFADPNLNYGIDPAMVDSVAKEIAAVNAEGHQVAVVVGGGNIFRGLSTAAQGMDRANADYMGMLATVINALALRDAIERAGADCRVQTAISIQQVAEPYIRLRAIRHLEKGRIVVLAGGHRQPVLHHRHHGGVACRRDRCRRHAQGDPGRRGVRRRSPDQPGGDTCSPRSATSRSSRRDSR